MKFNRFFGSGYKTTRRDPRDKIYAEFICGICEEKSLMDVTTTMDTFDCVRDRKCKHCGQTSEGDKIINLKSQLNKMLEDKNKITIEIEQIIRELEEIERVDNEKKY